jgi:hypothetical protein
MNDTAMHSDVNAAEMVKAIENDPWGAVRSILGADLWEKVFDYKMPLPDGFAGSAYTALNAIGVLEGAAGQRNWLAGKSTKQAVEE